MNQSFKVSKSIDLIGKPLDFGEVFNDSFENYKKIALLMGVVFLLFFIIYFVLIAGIMGVFYSTMSYTDFLTGMSPESVTSSTFLAIQTIVKIILAGLLAPLSAGLIKMAHNAEIGEEFGIGTVFEYFKTKYFKDLFVCTLLISATMSIIGLICNLVVMKDLTNINNLQNLNYGNIWLVTIVTLILYLIIAILTFYTTPLIIFGQLSAIEAIKKSISLASKQFWLLLLLWFVTIICCCVGFIICIGFLFTFPFYFSVIYIVNKNAIGIENTNEIDQIGIQID